MQQLLGDKLGTLDANSFLRELFLQRLPANVRMVLASTDTGLHNKQACRLADKVLEVAMHKHSFCNPGQLTLPRSTLLGHLMHGAIIIWLELLNMCTLYESLGQTAMSYNLREVRWIYISVACHLLLLSSQAMLNVHIKTILTHHLHTQTSKPSTILTQHPIM